MNQLKFPKTTKASFDICGDRLKVIDFLTKSGRFHNTSELSRQLGIPTARLRDILQSRCEGYVARQGDRYGYSRTERKPVVIEPPKPEPKPEPTPKPKSSKPPKVTKSKPKPKPSQIEVTVSKPEPEADFLGKMARREERKLRSQLPTLRKAEFARIRRTLPNISVERATLMAYQRHPDI